MNNIVSANIKGRSVKTEPVFQYDTGLKLKITGVTLPAEYEVHFSNYESGTATSVKCTSDESDIPGSCLVSGRDVFAYVYLYDAEEAYGYTLAKITIPVIRRAAPQQEHDEGTEEVVEE